jgi:hypothetical protein
MVGKEWIVVGANFRFKDGVRRISKVENGHVYWVYADGEKRMGQIGGTQRIKHFAKEAIEKNQETWSDIRRDARRAVRQPRNTVEWIMVGVALLISIALTSFSLHIIINVLVGLMARI